MNTEEVNQEKAVLEIIQKAGSINLSQLYHAMKDVMPSSRYIGIITRLRDTGHVRLSGPFVIWEGGGR